MLITFKSKAAAELVMYKIHAKPILDLFGKNLDQGIITAEETADAITKLEAAIAASKRDQAQENLQADDSDEEQPQGLAAKVAFSTRAFPLLEMLKAANRTKQFVMWGV